MNLEVAQLQMAQNIALQDGLLLKSSQSMLAILARHATMKIRLANVFLRSVVIV
jgi:hypothetical protein